MILKTMFRPKFQLSFMLLLAGTLIMSCESDDTNDVTLYEKGQANVTIGANPQRLEPILFESGTSTKVVSRTWAFPGGNPATSVDESVSVTYPWGGEYTATLTVKYIDNQTEKKAVKFTIGGPIKPISPPLTGTVLGIFTERTAPAYNNGKAPNNNGNMVITADLTLPYEGDTCWFYHFDAVNSGNTQNGFGLSHMDFTTSPLDATAYNYLNIAIKTASNRSMRIRHNTSAGNFWVTLNPAAPAYGMIWDGAWHTLKIPYTAMKKDGNLATLAESPASKAALTSFTIRTDDADYSSAANSFDVYIDDIYLSAN